ncbi:MAG TPA: bifunctional adenosylcobinamide kinase/adenosylcobinamide-phosphate guanylyltransferase [Thiobacillus sp.]|nr:MAG: bifunctional adenosylcobinamide kinase/adenosylcobinamide-phosphate guanylyltransferase [Hydrogenophilales bacterium 28-61-11]OYZ57555.1 MAG: bifunctional adenosylcobinamide kinase/adenosylcobinamide-phosphate guanylyltransferase [Hydrogenophilales bacterium 16-61-112]OZA50090.1 MAG: bifunctional adenosylcobinamide kinase/adenosylcobinamide-phosphate guanylyltransferase [Hydrogenophilales bacterium 17-61-76]HQT30291.1 bifunctional adenosylcobinamide kinase/adenosylcobinamide-phosphate gu
MLTLILGGARSGKSRLALQRAQATGQPVSFIATAQAHDAEMADRIARHQSERPAHWTTIEAPLDLAGAIRAAPSGMVVVDCLTLWLTNWLCQPDPDDFASARAALLAVLQARDADEIILVSNETGLGIVPLGELTRRFVDEAGWLNQDLAQLADEVIFVAAGLPLTLKGPLP